MTSTEALETPRAKRPLSSRLKAHARKAAIPAMLLSVTLGGVGVSTTAHAAEAPSCSTTPNTHVTCPAQAPYRGTRPTNNPAITPQNWNGALSAATFWSMHGINHFNGLHELVTEGNPQYHGGWPGDTARSAVGWYHWTTGTFLRRETNWIWYGGVFNDRNHRLSNLEASFGVPASRRQGVHQVYREYDMLGYTTGQRPGSGSRGQYRIVRNVDTGHVYATFDHYTSFHYLGRW